MKHMNKLLALLLALAMVLSMAACGGSTSDSDTTTTTDSDTTSDAADDADDVEETDDADDTDAKETSSEVEGYIPVPSDDAKYTVEVTDDGWIKIENEDGETLGLSPTSGVTVIEDDGYAFKDLNQNGELDAYEDWRLTSEERAENLVSLMSGSEMAAILAHGGWGDFTTEALTEDDTSYTFLMAGGRGGVTRNIGRGGGVHAQWTNQIQAVAESCWYGIPAMISIDPSNISGLVECVALASTMDTELAAELGEETAKEYRAAGITAFLGPQIDISGATMERSFGTYGEDPLLTTDIATAYVNAMQSTYDEDGTDLGWGSESVYCFSKHYAGAGATEAGRNDHATSARYAVFPGDNLEAHLIPFFDGVLDLPGLTGSSGIMTQYSVNVDGNGDAYGGEEVAGAYNAYMYGLLEEYGFSGLKMTDWEVYTYMGVWGAEDMTEAERIAYSWEQGAELLGGYDSMDTVAEAYEVLVENNGQEVADEIISNAAYDFILVMMNLNMFDQPYNDSAYADSIISTGTASELALESQAASVVMIKNDGTISEDGAVSEKPTVYVPYVYNTGFAVSAFTGISEGTPSWEASMDLDALSEYFNVVTDTLCDPSGEDEDGNAVYTENDIIRASAEEIAECDYILVGMTAPYTTSYNANYVNAWNYMTAYEEGTLVSPDDIWYPVSLQYGEYTATTARDPSISGMTLEDGTQENRSYQGNTAAAAANYGDLTALEYAASVAGDIPVIVSMCMERGMVWSEVEPLADVILVCYNNQYPEVVSEIILGETEPNGLLVFQQPSSMEAVEEQLEDVPRDMDCYVDSNGNTYDFAFGLNWSGVIDDDRVATYSAEPLTEVQNLDYDAYAASYSTGD